MGERIEIIVIGVGANMRAYQYNIAQEMLIDNFAGGDIKKLG